MSNETMTDARALREVASECNFAHPDTREAWDYIAARLRGEAAQNFMGMTVVVDEWMPTDAIRVVAAAQGEQQAVASPANCRNRLMAEGKPYPRSGCDHCKTGGLTGCPYERKVHDRSPQPVAIAGGAARVLLDAAKLVASHAPRESRQIDADWDRLREVIHETEAALSAVTAAPEAGKVVVSEAALRLAIRELNHARKGVDSAGRANYVHRLLLAMLGQEPIHDVEEPVAPAPVAGDAAWGWQHLASDWLEQQAEVQEETNAKYPQHAAAYKAWRDRPLELRMLAEKVKKAEGSIKRHCPPPSWMFPDDGAVSKLPESWRVMAQDLRASDGGTHKAIAREECARELTAALAQDRASQGADWVCACGDSNAANESCAVCEQSASQGAAAVVPEGWQLVPLKPTVEMGLAGLSAPSDLGSKWAAMLAAAPSSPTPAAEREVR